MYRNVSITEKEYLSQFSWICDNSTFQFDLTRFMCWSGLKRYIAYLYARECMFECGMQRFETVVWTKPIQIPHTYMCAVCVWYDFNKFTTNFSYNCKRIIHVKAITKDIVDDISMLPTYLFFGPIYVSNHIMILKCNFELLWTRKLISLNTPFQCSKGILDA